MQTFIKRERKKRGIQQKALAASLNIAPATLAIYENTDRDPPLETLCKIADQFGLTLDVLVRGKEKDRQQGRSVKDLVNDFDSLTDEHLEMMIEVAQAVLAERRLLARQKKDGKQTP